MKHLSAKFSLAFALAIGLFAFNACQKDGITPKEGPVGAEPGVLTDRSPNGVTYGVSVFDGVNASQIVQIDDNTGNATANFGAFYIDGNGTVVDFDNLTGICLTQFGRYIVSTGSPASSVLGASAFDNSLFYLNQQTGECFIMGSVSPFGSVSDIEYNPFNNSVVGLMDNSNSIIEILPDGNGNPTIYGNPIPVVGIAPGSALKGLSIVRDASGLYFVGCANQTGAVGVPTSLYNINIATGVAGLLTNLLPASDFAGGHCGIGFDIQLNHLAINRRNPTGMPPGLNEVAPWAVPLGANTPTANYGVQNFDFEDLSSWVY